VTAPPAQRLVDAWQQCQRHQHHMNHALSAIQQNLPMTASSVATLDDEEVQDWDQFILRFTKLQDAIGSRLFTALLEYLLEPAADQPMIDKLNRLEKLGYIERAETWQVLRSIRNRFTHDYPDDDALRAAALNEAVGAANVLGSMLSVIKPLVDRARIDAGAIG